MMHKDYFMKKMLLIGLIVLLLAAGCKGGTLETLVKGPYTVTVAPAVNNRMVFIHRTESEVKNIYRIWCKDKDTVVPGFIIPEFDIENKDVTINASNYFRIKEE
ncbi:hypothetical protein AGMMS50267_03970 [Spirochaetia bacterium]|nr:hypothetical protein AGMMS50267_03970 [Spirochaetia bacterium]